VCCPFSCAFLISETFLWSRACSLAATGAGHVSICFSLPLVFCSLCLAPNCQIHFYHFVRSCFDLLFTHQIQSVLSSFSISLGAVLCSSPGHKCFPNILSAGIFTYRQVHLCRRFRFACFGFWRCQGHYSSLWFFVPRRVCAQSKLWASVQQKPPTSAFLSRSKFSLVRSSFRA
jgi:hypothetical protein